MPIMPIREIGILNDMTYTDREKEILIERFRQLLDSGDEWEVFETAEPVEQWIDLYPRGGIQGLSHRIVRTTYTLGIKKVVTEKY